MGFVSQSQDRKVNERGFFKVQSRFLVNFAKQKYIFLIFFWWGQLFARSCEVLDFQSQFNVGYRVS